MNLWSETLFQHSSNVCSEDKEHCDLVVSPFCSNYQLLFLFDLAAKCCLLLFTSPAGVSHTQHLIKTSHKSSGCWLRFLKQMSIRCYCYLCCSLRGGETMTPPIQPSYLLNRTARGINSKKFPLSTSCLKGTIERYYPTNRERKK